MPNFHDLPDGSSFINHTGEDFWVEIGSGDEMLIPGPNPASPATPPAYPEGVTRWPAPQSAPSPNPVGYSSAFPPPMTATQVAEAQRVARINPEWETAPYQCSPPPNPPVLRRRNPSRRRGSSDPDAAIRKDPNAWSLREAVELCKLLEVVVPEAGFHIALTGPLLYLDGKRKECHLMFYQIRGVDPNYEVLWKYLTVAGVIRSPSYPENGWLVKATYRGKAIDCLFPNAKKAKKVGAAKDDCYKAALEELRATPASAPPPEGYIVNPAWEAGAPVLVRHNDGSPILYRRSPDAPGPYDPAELLATPAPAPSHPAVEAARIVETTARIFTSPPVAQWEEPF